MDKKKQIEKIALTEVDILANDLNQHCADLADNYCGGISCLACLTHAITDKGYRKASEVAREIFEEIEREINDALQSNYKVLPLIEQSESLWNRVNGKIDALRGIEGYIAEIKMKYTESEKDNG